MKINKNTWHYKMWRSSFTNNHLAVPETTDLCRYCHKVFWLVFGRVMLAAMVAMTAALLSYGILYKCMWQHPLPTFITLGASAIVVTLVVLYSRWLDGNKNKEPKADSLPTSWLKARKQKVCPLVEFSE